MAERTADERSRTVITSLRAVSGIKELGRIRVVPVDRPGASSVFFGCCCCLVALSVVLYMNLFIIHTYANTVSPRALLLFNDTKLRCIDDDEIGGLGVRVGGRNKRWGEGPVYAPSTLVYFQCVCVRACVRARVRACVRACVSK